MVMARDLAIRAASAIWRKVSAPIRLREMGAAEAHRPGVVIALDPDPAPTGHQAGEPERLCLTQRRGGLRIVEAVAEAEQRSGVAV